MLYIRLAHLPGSGLSEKRRPVPINDPPDGMKTIRGNPRSTQDFGKKYINISYHASDLLFDAGY